MTIRVLALVGVLFIASTASASDATNRFALRGAGLASCEQFLKAMQERQENVLVAGGWIEGYVTAVNKFTADTFDIAPWQSTQALLGLVTRNCERNPQAGFFQVVDSMIKYLMPARLTAQSERVLVESGDTKFYIYRSTMKNVQEKLISLGHLKGGADGQYGPQTKTALEAYQTAQQLEATGVPDQNTLFKLLTSPGG